MRELQNAVERAMITSTGRSLHSDLPTGSSRPRTSRASANDDPAVVMTDAEMKRRERDNIIAALHATGWRVSGPDGTAKLLGIPPTTLASRIKKLGIER